MMTYKEMCATLKTMENVKANTDLMETIERFETSLMNKKVSKANSTKARLHETLGKKIVKILSRGTAMRCKDIMSAINTEDGTDYSNQLITSIVTKLKNDELAETHVKIKREQIKKDVFFSIEE